MVSYKIIAVTVQVTSFSSRLPPERTQYSGSPLHGVASAKKPVAGFRKCVFAPSEELSIYAGGNETDQQKINDLIDGFKDLHVVNRHIKDVRAEDDGMEK
uniref:AlNc14C87G5555 protein n=1 Tax=Albugo laibachii Nc14 TaxID=890382 RepID=F0WG23_9STRA|nr:AlNc14C87G5555 [Albugo laibachii Nc14]|eukprot:CCA20157.1 AlNc14C87G5555 [Albugo laibachii Nc14]